MSTKTGNSPPPSVTRVVSPAEEAFVSEAELQTTTDVTKYMLKPKYMSQEQFSFDRQMVEQLMVLDPSGTRESIRVANDEEKIHKFLKFCRRVQLRQENYYGVNTVEKLNRTMSAIKTCLKFVITSASYLNLLSRRLLRCTRIVQAFVRKALIRHREIKKKLLDRWKDQEAASRKIIRTEVEYWAARSKSATSHRMIEEMWEVYMKCWVSKDEMVAAIHSCWVERRDSYVKRYRAWRKLKKSEIAFGAMDTITKKRQREMKACSGYPFMLFKASQVSLAELVAHHDLLAMRKISASVKQQAIAQGKKPKEFPQTVGDPAKLVSPVSLYHALLNFDRKEMHLMVFLHQLQSTGHVKLPPGPSPSVKEQAALAKTIQQRWEDRGVITVLPTEDAEKKKIRMRRGSDGQPKGLMQMLREAAEAQPNYLSPVASLNPTPHASPGCSLRRGSESYNGGGGSTSFFLEKGAFTVSPKRVISPRPPSAASSRPQGPAQHLTTSPQRRSPSAITAWVEASVAARSISPPQQRKVSVPHSPMPPGGLTTEGGGRSSVLSFSSRSQILPPQALKADEETKKAHNSEAPEGAEIVTAVLDIEPRLVYPTSGPRPHSARPPGYSDSRSAQQYRAGGTVEVSVAESEKKESTMFRTKAGTLINMKRAESHWKATEKSRTLRRPVSARERSTTTAGSKLAAKQLPLQMTTSSGKTPAECDEPSVSLVTRSDKSTSCTTLVESAAADFYRTAVLGLSDEKSVAASGDRWKEEQEKEKERRKVRRDPDREKKLEAASERRKRIASLRPTIAKQPMKSLRPVGPTSAPQSLSGERHSKTQEERTMHEKPTTHPASSSSNVTAPSRLTGFGSQPQVARGRSSLTEGETSLLVSRPLTGKGSELRNRSKMQ